MSEAFGSAAEEAARLVDALGEWIASRAGGAGSTRLEDWLPSGSADCRLCPVCQLIGVLRQSRPEIVGHLDDALGSLLAAARLALESSERARAPRPAFERIDIG